jgi:hypothetical protein
MTKVGRLLVMTKVERLLVTTKVWRVGALLRTGVP